MSVICRAYDAEPEAHRAVDKLMELGVDGRAIKVVMGQHHDLREEPEGRFAGGELPPEHEVGEFAGPAVESDEAMGTFIGDAAHQREGSFADADRETVTSYPAGVERQSIEGEADLRKMLADAGLDKATVDRDVSEANMGHVLVLADVGDRDAATVDAALP
jgi:hypothetical protein